MYWNEIVPLILLSRRLHKDPLALLDAERKFSPLQPSSSSSEHSSPASFDEELGCAEEDSKEETESQGYEEEIRGEEEDEEDDDGADDDYPDQENIAIGASAPNDTEIDTLPNNEDDLFIDVETCNENICIVGIRYAKEVDSSKSSPAEYRKKSPPSSHKAPTKRTNHERSPQPRRRVLSLGGGGGDEEDEGEIEEQKKKRKQDEHQGKEVFFIQSTPTKEVKKINKGRVLVQRLPLKPATKHPEFDLDACLRALSMSTTHDEEIEQDVRSKDKEEELSNGEKVRNVDTFVSNSRKEISINHCYSKEKHP